MSQNAPKEEPVTEPTAEEPAETGSGTSEASPSAATASDTDSPPTGDSSDRDDGVAEDADKAAPKVTRTQRRREKIRDEIERNRRGEYTVPTWVLVMVLAAILVGWALIVFLA